MIRHIPPQIVDLAVQLVFHLLLRPAIEDLIGFIIARVNILQRQMVLHRPGGYIPRPLQPLNRRRLDVVIGVVVVIDEVLNLIAIRGEAPVDRPR